MSSSVMHHPFRAWENRVPVPHGILKPQLIRRPVGNSQVLPHVIWFKYVNHTISVLLITNFITPHLSLYVRKRAILNKHMSTCFHQQKQQRRPLLVVVVGAQSNYRLWRDDIIEVTPNPWVNILLSPITFWISLSSCIEYGVFSHFKTL